ncbi:MAG: FAD-binding oxidoreductase [Chloroflexia bacterium]
MRRWNGWGDDSVIYPVPERAARFLEERLGPGTPPRDVSLPEVLASVPPSRLRPYRLVSQEAWVRLCHARGQSLPDWIALRYGRIPAFPDGVAFPEVEEDVRDLLKYAAEVGARVIPYGGGTSVVGHVNPLPGEGPVLTVSLSRMNALRKLDAEAQLATFEAGVTGPELEAQLKPYGFTLGHFPQSFEYSTLGGWIASRSSGQQSLGYGRIERLFAGGRLEAPTGTLVFPPFPGSAAGPDLREAVLGSEGRLGILTEATVRITPLPEREEFHAAFFPDWEAAVAAARAIVQARLPLSMLRISTPEETETTLALAGHERLISALEKVLALRGAGKGKCMAILGFTGREKVVRLSRSETLRIARDHGGIHVGRTFGTEWHRSRFRTPYLRNALWEMGYAVDTLETAVPWPAVPVLVADLQRTLTAGLETYGEAVHVFSHLSHLYPSGSSIYTTYLFRLPVDPDEALERWRRLKRLASQAIVAHGGTISHQHGVGTDHLPYLAAEKGELGLMLVESLCRTLDPLGIMNPGKLIEGRGCPKRSDLHPGPTSAAPGTC